MPICERDPWRLQFFETAACPDGLNIPTDDLDCWPWMPRHRWVYNRLLIAESQGIAAAPHGVEPPSYPVFSKPIINLRGMGLGSRTIETAEDMAAASAPGHMWMELLQGPHVSTDCAVVRGKVCWIRHSTGLSAGGGMFDYWTVHAAEDPALCTYISNWAERHLADYTGMLNVETIGGRIIEMHLRFADQWCDLYGGGWVDALVKLYQHGVWALDDSKRTEGYSIPLFAQTGQTYRHPSAECQARIRAMAHITSLQITFHDQQPEQVHAMPPGGFRLGIINSTNLSAGMEARRALGECFPGITLMLPE